MDFTRQQVTESLRRFKSYRDNALHEEGLANHLHQFVRFCSNDAFVQSVLGPIVSQCQVDALAWWNDTRGRSDHWVTTLEFPDDPSQELALRYNLLRMADENRGFVANFGIAVGKHKSAEWDEAFRVMIVRPFAQELSERLGEAANLASPEARALQAVPLSRIPSDTEIRIFLSHKSVDKPLVYRYFQALKELGFDPWLDEDAMPAGTNLERGILTGFEESCAAVFFITDNFKDESYLATEVDYAVIQKRKKDRRFAIITLRYSDAAPVPGLLTPFIYRTVANDLEGFRELLRALPIELGPVRWKEGIVD